ncbi:hypothetical protein [Nonomuraea aurantiaca]|uniref:hypothetical protein n=1 Tax=Nonomuraea aurantiaca TaxID=2878562 RepID=UPI001CD995B7|nr:hypothetical protein [Nonomuraea aurantiaca]MCA2225287.1 hypothetical protein [Nonomuraea aurantiaca]
MRHAKAQPFEAEPPGPPRTNAVVVVLAFAGIVVALMQISSAVSGAILAQLNMSLGPVTVPSQNGFRVVLALGAGMALIALVIMSFIPGRRPAASAGTTRTAVPAHAKEPSAG